MPCSPVSLEPGYTLEGSDGLLIGMVARRVVPAPTVDSITISPPSSAIRSRIATNPNPSPAVA